jgi:hypothetical protein
MSQQKERKELARMLRRLAIEKRPFACMGCGLEHGCSSRGCAVMRRAAEILGDMEEPEDAGLGKGCH